MGGSTCLAAKLTLRAVLVRPNCLSLVWWMVEGQSSEEQLFELLVDRCVFGTYAASPHKNNELSIQFCRSDLEDIERGKADGF
jgi:hypothetical protein